MVRTVIPFRSPTPDAEADAFVASRLREEQGVKGDRPAALDAGQGEIEAVWDALGQLEAADFAAVDGRTTGRGLNRRAWIAAGTMAASVAAGGVFLWRQKPVIYETRIGERRTIALPDGSRVTLNTGSRISARFDGRRREIVLEAGEAFFDVAHQDETPFDVLSHESRIRVTGTRFNVYRHDAFTDVDLLEGGVAAGPAARPSEPGVRLRAGQAVRLSRSGNPDAFSAAQDGRIEDWRNGRVSFDRTPLRSAVIEMNRYSRAPLRILDPSLEDLPIDGVFEAGDTAAFAKAVGLLDGVSVRFEQGAWTLS